MMERSNSLAGEDSEVRTRRYGSLIGAQCFRTRDSESEATGGPTRMFKLDQCWYFKDLTLKESSFSYDFL